MSPDDPIHAAARTSKARTLLPLLTIWLGLVLLVYMVTVESEPGALPLLLIVIGVAWYAIARARARARPE